MLIYIYICFGHYFHSKNFNLKTLFSQRRCSLLLFFGDIYFSTLIFYTTKKKIPVLLLHLVGGIVGYWLPKLTGFGEVKSRTMAIETSMKSSAFGFLLAKLHFGEYVARVPSAVSVVWMALTGSFLAVVWRYIPVKEGE